MMTDPLFTVSTAYTLSTYRDYNRAVQAANGVYRRIWLSAVIYIAAGALLCFLLETWMPAPLFVILAAVNIWLNFRNLRRAEDFQYQQEQLIGTVRYDFYDDRIDVTTTDGTTQNPYSGVQRVYETDRSYLIMFAPMSGAILPREDCSPELIEFLATRFKFERLRSPRSI